VTQVTAPGICGGRYLCAKGFIRRRALAATRLRLRKQKEPRWAAGELEM